MTAGISGFAIPLVFPGIFSELWSLNLVFGGFFFIIVAIIRINIVLSREYRCPGCDREVIVFKAEGGIPLDPKECPRCGIRLK
jgi:DNA-directed RNA polymerase subunit RPC12/RpoP